MCFGKDPPLKRLALGRNRRFSFATSDSNTHDWNRNAFETTVSNTHGRSRGALETTVLRSLSNDHNTLGNTSKMRRWDTDVALGRFGLSIRIMWEVTLRTSRIVAGGYLQIF